jgi:hypothetical protein
VCPIDRILIRQANLHISSLKYKSVSKEPPMEKRKKLRMTGGLIIKAAINFSKKKLYMFSEFN